MEYIGRGIATVGVALICGCMMYYTKGKHGIGWFIVGLLFIW